MTKLLTAAALIATLAAAPVFAPPAFARDTAGQRSFTRDGETYVYTATVKGNATILSGRSTSGRDFRLTVRDGHVTGRSGGLPVSFDVASANADAMELAAR